MHINRSGPASGAISNPNSLVDETASPVAPSSSRRSVSGPLANLMMAIPRRPPNTTPAPASLAGLPFEIRSLVLDRLDGVSAAKMAKVSTGSHADVMSNSRALQAIRCGVLMVHLKTICKDDEPDGEPNDETLSEIRDCASSLTAREARRIVKLALGKGAFGFTKVRMLGALIGGCSDDEAEYAAKRLDRLSIRIVGISDSQNTEDKINRGKVLTAILGSIGEARSSLYEPFVTRLKSENYYINGFRAEELSNSLPNMPQSVRDEVCAALLDHDVAYGRNRGRHTNTLQMFFALNFLSASMQEAVFLKAKSIYDSHATDEDQEQMALRFEVEHSSRDDIFKELAPDIREKWEAMFAN